MCNGRPPAAPRRSWAPLVYSLRSGRTRLLAASRRRAIARPRPAGLGDRRCGAGRADGLASVLSKGHEPESGRALAPPAYRTVSRGARPQPAPSLRPVDGARDQPDRVPGGILGTRARLGLAHWTRRRRPGGTQHRHAGQMVPTLRSGALRGRCAALGAGEPAARRLRTTGWRRARPDIARVANAVRNRLVGRRAPSRRDIRRQGRSRSARRVRGAGDAAGNRPSGPGRQSGDARRTPDDSPRDRVAVAATGDLRTLQHAQPHPHRARHVPVTHVRRHPGRRPARLRSRLARFHLLRQSPRRPPNDVWLHARDALGRRLPQRDAAPRVPSLAIHPFSTCLDSRGIDFDRWPTPATII